MLIEDLRLKILGILTDFPQILLVYFFGSRAAGKATKNSDYDFAIAVTHKKDTLALQTAFQHALVELLDFPKVDVVMLNNAPVELAYAVIRDGKLLFAVDAEERVEFEAGILNKYMDYLPYLHDYQEQILAGGAIEKRTERYREALGRTYRPSGKIVSP